MNRQINVDGWIIWMGMDYMVMGMVYMDGLYGLD